jgi:hypothetical protein
MAGASEIGSKKDGELFADLVRKPPRGMRLAESPAVDAGAGAIAALTSKLGRRSAPPPPPTRNVTPPPLPPAPSAARVLTPLPMIAVGTPSVAPRVKPPTPPRPPPSECTDPTLNIEPEEISEEGIQRAKSQAVRPAVPVAAAAAVASPAPALKAPNAPRPPRPALPKTPVDEPSDVTPTHIMLDYESDDDTVSDDDTSEHTDETPTEHLGKLPLSALSAPRIAAAPKRASLPPLTPARAPSVPPPAASRKMPSVPPLPALPSLPPMRASAPRSSLPPVSSPPRSSISLPRTSSRPGSAAGNRATLPPSEPSALRPRMDTSPSVRAPSIAPVAYSAPSIAPIAASRTPRIAAALGIAAGLLLGLPLLLANTPVMDALAGSGSSLVVTVSGPGSTPVSAVSVVVDDVPRCDISPCRVTGLQEGSHFVKIVAPGYEATAPRAVALRGSDDTLLNVELARSQRDATVSPEPVQTSVDALPALRRSGNSGTARSSAPGARRNTAQPSSPEPRSPVGAKGSRLTINSVPASTVVLDGRPMGMTPLVGVSVSPGAHSVIFVHPEHGRKAASVSVEPGASRGVSVRF